MKIDLHSHTKHSDGSDSVIEILQNAEAAGLTHFSITDHNTVDAYFQIDDVKKYFSGKLIIGVEPECGYKGRVVELLGYNFDLAKMKEHMSK